MTTPPADPPADPPVADPPADPPATGTPPGDPALPDPAKLAEQVDHWKAMSRKNETRARENAAKAKQFDDLTEAQKTELQKASDRATAAEQRAASAEAEKHRLLAAATNDLDPGLIEFLGSGTEDEISERAKTMAGIINAKVDAALVARGIDPNGQQQPVVVPGGRRPVDSLRPGGQPTSDLKPKTPDDWFRALVQNSRNQS